jgi:hypothetical protein
MHFVHDKPTGFLDLPINDVPLGLVNCLIYLIPLKNNSKVKQLVMQ